MPPLHLNPHPLREVKGSQLYKYLPIANQVHKLTLKSDAIFLDCKKGTQPWMITITGSTQQNYQIADTVTTIRKQYNTT